MGATTLAAVAAFVKKAVNATLIVCLTGAVETQEPKVRTYVTIGTCVCMGDYMSGGTC